MTNEPPLQPGDYVRFTGFGAPTFSPVARPGRLIQTDSTGSTDRGLVRWLDEDSMYSVPLDRLTRAEPQTTGDLIEDEDGAPLPEELQRGGHLWMAALDGVRTGFLGRAAEQSQAYDLEAAEAADSVMIRLAPILWPLLPSNDASPTAVIARHGSIYPGTEQPTLAALSEAVRRATPENSAVERLQAQGRVLIEANLACADAALRDILTSRGIDPDDRSPGWEARAGARLADIRVQHQAELNGDGELAFVTLVKQLTAEADDDPENRDRPVEPLPPAPDWLTPEYPNTADGDSGAAG